MPDASTAGSYVAVPPGTNTAETSGSYTAEVGSGTAAASGSYVAVAANVVATTSGSYTSVLPPAASGGWSLWHYLGGGVLAKADLYRWDGTSLIRLNTASPNITPTAGPAVYTDPYTDGF